MELNSTQLCLKKEGKELEMVMIDFYERRRHF